MYTCGCIRYDIYCQQPKDDHPYQENARKFCESDGGSLAILNTKEIDDLIRETEGASIANDNSESQVVLSGYPEAVRKVADNLKCKRAIPLQVSGAFHSKFMTEASQSFAEELDQVTFQDAQIRR